MRQRKERLTQRLAQRLVTAKARAIERGEALDRARVLPKEDLPASAKTPVFYWSAVVPGLALRVTGAMGLNYYLVYKHGQRDGQKDARRNRLVPLGRAEHVSVKRAEEKARDALDRLGRGMDPKPVTARTVRDLWEEYKKHLEDRVAAYRTRGKAGRKQATQPLKPQSAVGYKKLGERYVLKPPFSDMAVNEVTVMDVRRFHGWVVQNAGPAAANRMLTPLKEAFRVAEFRGWRDPDSNPVRLDRGEHAKERREPKPLQPEDYGRVWERCSEYLSDHHHWPAAGAVLLILATGCRKNEIARVRKDQIETWEKEGLKGGRLTLDEEDSKTPRQLPLTELAVEVLESLPATESSYLFPRWGSDGKEPVTLDYYWRKLRQELGIEATIHGVRHLWASELPDVTDDPVKARDALGHRDLATTFGVYHQPRFEKTMETSQRLARHLRGLIVRQDGREVN